MRERLTLRVWEWSEAVWGSRDRSLELWRLVCGCCLSRLGSGEKGVLGWPMRSLLRRPLIS